MKRYVRNSAFAILSVAIVTFAAGIGTLVTMPNIPTWYVTLNKPFFNPPNWLFGPVWTMLYLLLAFSFWRILKCDAIGPDRTRSIIGFAIQMLLNPLWSIAFFYWHNPKLALAIVILLALSVLNMIRMFSRIDRFAANLQWPYAGWVAFATILNAAIVLLN